jgi:MFS family permease
MTAVDAPVLAYSSAPGRWVVAITVLGSGIAALDATVVNIALPTIGRDFHTGIAALQWVMTSYILALLPLTLIMLALSARSGELAAKIGPRLQLTVGPVVVGAGLAMLTFSTSGPGYAVHVLPAIVVFGVGIAITVAPLTATAMSSAPAHLAGIASAVNNDLSRFGGLLAVAILPALAGITGQAYLHPAALAAGFRTAAFISGGLCAAGGLLAAVTITNPPRAPEPAGTPGPCLHCALEAPPLTIAPAGYAEASTTVRSV